MTACSACSSPPELLPLDASVPDAKSPRRDSSTDNESPIPDATGFDAGFDPFQGTWGPLPGEPANCDVKIDYAPQTDITPFAWKVCSSGRPSCQRLVIDWTTAPGSQVGFPWQPVGLIKGVPFISYQKIFPGPGASPLAGINIVADLTGHASFATGGFVNSPLWCVGSYYPTATSGLFVGGGGNKVLTLLLGSGPWAAPKDTSVVAKSQGDFQMAVGPQGGTFQRAVGNGSVLVLETSDPFSLALYDTSADKITLVPGSQNGRIPAEFPIAVKNGALAMESSATQGLWFVGLDGASARVYLPVGGNLVFAADADESNADSFVWMEGTLSNFDYKNVSLFTAPYATSTNGVVGKRATGIPSLYNYGGFMVANAGMALLLTSSTTAELVRLTDGWAWSLTAEPEDIWSQALWVDDTSVWLAVASAKSGGAFVNGIVKFDRTKLGPPTIPPN